MLSTLSYLASRGMSIVHLIDELLKPHSLVYMCVSHLHMYIRHIFINDLALLHLPEIYNFI